MGCGHEYECAEPARKHEPTIVNTRTPADRVKQLDGQPDSKRQLDLVGKDNEDERERRETAIEQFEMVVDFQFEVLETAIGRAERVLSVPEKAKGSSWWASFFEIAVSSLFAGIAGATGQWAAAAIVHQVAKKFVGDAVKDAITKALRPKSSSGAPASSDLKEAFVRRIEDERLAAVKRHASEWPLTKAILQRASSEDLERFNVAEIRASHTELADTIERQILVAWTNLLARAVHGGMGPWDPWQRHGRDMPGHTLPLRGAAKSPYEAPENERVDPMAQNVEPRSMYWAIDTDQRPMEDEHVGILEIHLWADRALNLEPEYGMRLDNVGPGVRKSFKESGKLVRDLAVNKVVRVSNFGPSQINPPRADGAFLITADGHVRLTSWPYNRDLLAQTAERAQDLPLSHLRA